MNKVGLYFGSFNPFHIGHFWVAKFAQYTCQLDQVWFIPSPQSPFKKAENLLDISERIEIIKLSIQQEDTFKIVDIETHLPVPSYTSTTIKELIQKFPEYDFSLLLGQDSVEAFHLWKNYEYILDFCPLMVFPRSTEPLKLPFTPQKDKVIFLDKMPIISVSSTMIRERIQHQLPIHHLLNRGAEKYILSKGFYQN